ncbi:hypothetical protein Tco_1299484, partial [Tanacetum coccineum]
SGSSLNSSLDTSSGSPSDSMSDTSSVHSSGYDASALSTPYPSTTSESSLESSSKRSLDSSSPSAGPSRKRCKSPTTLVPSSTPVSRSIALTHADILPPRKRFRDPGTDNQEVLGFLDSSTSGNPTPSDPIIASSSPSFTPFEGGDFILEEIETFLRTPDELSNLDDDYYDTEEDILYLEKLLNEDPSSNLPPMKNDDLKQVDVTLTKPSIKEPPELELKDLPSHLEYAFLEGTDKLPVIISKELKDEEKAALLKMTSNRRFNIKEG